MKNGQITLQESAICCVSLHMELKNSLQYNIEAGNGTLG